MALALVVPESFSTSHRVFLGSLDTHTHTQRHTQTETDRERDGGLVTLFDRKEEKKKEKEKRKEKKRKKRKEKKRRKAERTYGNDWSKFEDLLYQML